VLLAQVVVSLLTMVESFQVAMGTGKGYLNVRGYAFSNQNRLAKNNQ